ncbi:Secondary metabolism regulator laeA [Golovinomyces cichoracearum]|uniref:Secondary metabolism regulator laeA n=1 Tax=Golovinomyces cichoracearum TaxID=62708 RepID=A0A420J3S2_9PEZI|nr:Secondary metabolism regulator laeA [Golovinomyces cichoracearum]
MSQSYTAQSALLTGGSLPSSRDDDLDSTLGDDDSSGAEYCSATESIYDFRVENGRTYHASTYFRMTRMDIVYQAITRIFNGKAFFAPVRHPHRVVDMGTGTGAWAIDVGDQYPEAHVIGIDLSPIQPKWVAPNVEFRVDDIENPWAISRSISLIHSRLMSGHSIRSWPNYLRECFSHLSPGGWVEAQEISWLPLCSPSGPFPPESSILRWHSIFHRGMRNAGHNLCISAEDIARAMEEAGFINVRVHHEILPMGPWCSDRRMREAGTLVRESVLQGIGGISSAVFTRILGWGILDMELFLERVRKEFRSKKIHGFWPLLVLHPSFFPCLPYPILYIAEESRHFFNNLLREVLKHHIQLVRKNYPQLTP